MTTTRTRFDGEYEYEDDFPRSHTQYEDDLAPVAETGLSHRLTAYKIVGHFFSYMKISLNNQVENSFV